MYAMVGLAIFGYGIAVVVFRYSRWLNGFVMSEVTGERKWLFKNSAALEYLRISWGVLLLYWLFGGVFFYLTEMDQGWTFLDAMYFCFVSISTIGFGDFTPNFHDKATIVFQMLYIFIGIPLFQLVSTVLK
jgi:hypothetical protein